MATVLTPLAAVGCGSSVDVANKALGLASAESHDRSTPAVYASDPVVGAAHGALLLPGGSTASAPLSFVGDSQRYYLERLLGEASPAVRAEFETLRRPLEGDPREVADNALLIAWLIEHVQPVDATDLKSINKFMAKAMIAGDLPTELGLVAGDSVSRANYSKRCSDALVPTPPDWNPDANDPANGWKKQSEPLQPVFIGEESTTATVWYHVSTDLERPGLCFALPRADSRGVITSLGVICQATVGDAACFWDSTRDIQPNAKVAILSDGFNAGPDLDGGIGGKCTDCHRGANAFITHPGSSLAIETIWPFTASGWVNPIVHSDWFQNSQEGHELNFDIGDGEDTCLRCHRLGRVGGPLPELGGKHSKYCDFVIMNAILPGPKQTMPPDGSTSLVFRSDMEAVATACGWDVSALGFPPRDTNPVP